MKMEAYCYEVGVLLDRDDEEYEWYSKNNPNLPYGFYNENETVFLEDKLEAELGNVRRYIEEGVEGTYGIVAFWGHVEEGSIEHERILEDEQVIGELGYTFFKYANEIYWSAAKIDGELVEGFLEEAIAQSLEAKSKDFNPLEVASAASKDMARQAVGEPEKEKEPR